MVSKTTGSSSSSCERAERGRRLLAETSKILSAESDPGLFFPPVLALIKEILGFDHVGVRLQDARGLLPIVSSIGLDRDYADLTSMVPSRETMFGRAFLDGVTIAVPDTRDPPESTHFRMLKKIIPVTALIHSPMFMEGKPIGVLMAYSTGGPYDFDDWTVSAYCALANMLAMAVVGHNLRTQVSAYSNTIEERVRSRTAQLEAANERLREMDRVKSDFLSNVSHELRTPLTSIQSFSEILLRYDIKDAGKREHFARVINEESMRLTRMIDDLLDISKIEAGKLQIDFEPVDLGETAMRAVTAMEPIFRKIDVTVDLFVEPGLDKVKANGDRLLQVFTNLLGNAAKFAPRSSKVRVTARRRGAFAMVSVSDSGQGIDPRKSREVFERFKQLRDPGQKAPLGTGLGLAICRDLVEAFGGYIWVESQGGKGATFYFTIPFMEKEP